MSPERGEPQGVPEGAHAAAADNERGSVPAPVRRQRMLGALREREFLSVSELGEMFEISEVTVRSDLNVLADEGRLLRLRGGAMVGRAHGERPFEETKAAHADEKARIGAAAAGLLRDGETVILDVGTTTTAVARALLAREQLRDIAVLTNAINIALELEAAIPRFTVVVLGGTLRPLQHSLVNPLGSLALGQISASVVFLGCNGIDPEGGVTNVNLPEAEIKRQMLAAARRRIVVADGSKVGRVELARLCSVDDIDMLVTDDSADQNVLSELAARGVEIMLAA